MPSIIEKKRERKVAPKEREKKKGAWNIEKSGLPIFLRRFRTPITDVGLYRVKGCLARHTPPSAGVQRGGHSLSVNYSTVGVNVIIGVSPQSLMIGWSDLNFLFNYTKKVVEKFCFFNYFLYTCIERNLNRTVMMIWVNKFIIL